MATLVWIEGWEHGALSTNGGGLCNGKTGTITVDATSKKTGAYGLNAAPAGAAAYITKNPPSAQSYSVLSFYICVHTFPGADADLIQWDGAAGTDISLQLVQSDHTLRLRSSTTYSGKTAALSADTWYRLDIKINVSANPNLGDLQLNGSAVTQLSVAQALTTISAIYFGVLSAVTASIYYDDILMSSTSGDYPLGAHAVEGLSPNGAGTSNPGTYIQDNGSVTVNDATNPANIELDEVPLTSTADYIKQTTLDVALYAEVTFADTGQTNIMGAVAELAYTSNTTSANSAGTRIRDGAAQETVLYTGDMSETSLFYKQKIITTPVAGWSQTTVNGLVARVGYATDATPNPYWQGLMIQVAYGTGGAPQTITADQPIATAEAFGSDQANFIFPSVGGLASAEAIPGPLFTVFLTPTGVGSAEGFGSAVISIIQSLLASAIASAEAFGSDHLPDIGSFEYQGGPAIMKVNYQFPAVGSIASGEAFGGPLFQLFLTPGGVSSSEAFGAAALAQITQLLASGIAGAEAFGAAQLNFSLLLTGISTSEVFGGATFNMFLAPVAIPGAEAFGASALVAIAFISPSGIASGEALGNSRLDFQLAPSSIISQEAVGNALFTLYALPPGIGTAEVFGSASIFSVAILLPSGIAGAEAFGADQLNFILQAQGIPSAEAHGAPFFTIFLIPPGISPSEAFGAAGVFQAIILMPSAIGSAEAFGAALANFILQAQGIAGEEAFGVPLADLQLVLRALYDQMFGAPITTIRFNESREKLVREDDRVYKVRIDN